MDEIERIEYITEIEEEPQEQEEDVEIIETPVEEPIRVYVKVDKDDNIIEINSEEFIFDKTGWEEIDSGFGDKYHHAQGNYLDKPITDDDGIYNYAFMNGKIIERDKSADILKAQNQVRIAELKQLLADTDYKAIKYAEGEISEEEYAPIREQRRAWRTEINAL